MAILAFEKDAGLGRCLVDGQNDDRAGVPDNITAGANATGFGHEIGGHTKNGAAVRNAGREDTSLRSTGRFRHAIILRYAARVVVSEREQMRKAGRPVAGQQSSGRRDQTKTREEPERQGTVAFVGVGKLASFLAPALAEAGFQITEIIVREGGASLRRARKLARRVEAKVVTVGVASCAAEVIWLAVPDGEIRGAAELLADRVKGSAAKFGFHSSGALGSGELEPLRKAGLAVASVHPLMTFVANSKPALHGVPFAIEGEAAAVRKASGVVRALGGTSFVIAQRHKPAYHAWATMTSPLLLAYLVTLEKAARQAGVEQKKARQMSIPILRQTLENYARLGPANSFSGPFIRGDVETVKKHLALLQRNPKTRAVYVALAKVALDGLTVKNRAGLRRLLEN